MGSFKLVTIASSLALICACGSDGGGSSDDPAVGMLKIGVTDGPVDGVDHIWVEVDGITLKPANGPQQEFLFSTPRAFDLKALNNGKTEVVFEQLVAAGEYNWMKLHVNADFDDMMDSYVDDDFGRHELRVPPERLKLGIHFVVTQGGTSSFVIEWNLRMGLTNPVGQPGYKLQPSLRITDMTQHGTIAGTVGTELLQPADCSSDSNTGEGNVVYVFEGKDVTPDDIDGADVEPLTTADVRLDDNGEQSYSVPFLSPGEYTVAFTCQAVDDVIPDDDAPGADVDNAISFTPGQHATVIHGKTEVISFTAI